MQSNVGQASRLPRSDASPSEQFMALDISPFSEGIRERFCQAIPAGGLGRRDACPTFNCIVTAKWSRQRFGSLVSGHRPGQLAAPKIVAMFTEISSEI